MHGYNLTPFRSLGGGSTKEREHLEICRTARFAAPVEVALLLRAPGQLFVWVSAEIKLDRNVLG